MVEPPEEPVPPAMIMAPRAMANGSTPSWLQKVASSEATVALIRCGEIFSKGTKVRQPKSWSAISCSRMPLRSRMRVVWKVSAAM